MTKPTIKMGIIGLGAIGERLIPSFMNHPDFKIHAICDTNTEHMKHINTKYALDAATYTSFEDLLKDPTITSIYIAVPPKWHHTYALQAFSQRKHVLCEKPLANSLNEAKEMSTAATKSSVVHAIHFPLHYSREVASLKEKINAIGSISRIELTMRFETWPRSWQQNEWIGKRDQGGFIREITPHFIQLTHTLFGKIESVQSNVNYPDDSTLCETEIIATGKINNSISFLVNGHSGLGQKDDLTYRIYGDKGILSLDQWAELKQGNANSLLEIVQTRETSASKTILDEFSNAVNKRPANIVSFSEGLAVQYVLESLL